MRGWVGPKRCLLGLVLCGLVLPAHGEHHERKRAERAEILGLEGRWRQAQVADDIATMDKLLSEEFVGVTASGQVVTKSQQLDRMRTHSLAISRLDLSDTRIKISGNLAVVTSLAQLDGTAEGSPLQGQFRYTRVYQRVPGDGWKITNFEATRVGRPDAGLRGPDHAARTEASPSSHLTSLARFVSRRPLS